MSAPQFAIQDVVYLTESAKVGSLESYKVSQVRQDLSGVWKYTISVPPKPPLNGPTFGDRLSLKSSLDFELEESALCTYCEAIDLALAAATARVASLTQLKLAHCTESESGSD